MGNPGNPSEVNPLGNPGNPHCVGNPGNPSEVNPLGNPGNPLSVGNVHLTKLLNEQKNTFRKSRIVGNMLI